jgi:hypothetical protein
VGINKKRYSHEGGKKGFKWKINQPKNITPKIRGCKKRSGVKWHGVLKQKGVKQGLGAL